MPALGHQDRNGEITPEELTLVLQRFDRDFSTQDARQLIAVVDKDGNGEMGFEEFKELLEEIME